MEPKTIRELKKGEFFRLTAGENAPVWVRGKYVREARKYSVYKYDDTNHERFFPGNKAVFTGFTF
ncbi:hypothetical protein [uncultured Bacteroides sp.]|uniref:hypothetical protein n=1 Tax=uncultured Bacteroides sp. TaxID=162156 RepID=UPI002595840C|nr:hypothetical protein [uncultured Bacteroides sp.]